MDPSSAGPLSALRDIHLPAPISILPPAPGWWLLGGLLLLVAAGSLLLVRARSRRERPWHEAAEEELARIETTYAAQRDVVALAESLSVLLRRSVRARFPEQKIAALRGEEWFAFLGRHAGSAAGADTPDPRAIELVRELTYTAYSGVGRATLPPQEWIVFVRTWIGAGA
jgi:Domain of unknown function (DUF4381)